MTPLPDLPLDFPADLRPLGETEAQRLARLLRDAYRRIDAQTNEIAVLRSALAREGMIG